MILSQSAAIYRIGIDGIDIAILRQRITANTRTRNIYIFVKALCLCEWER